MVGEEGAVQELAHLLQVLLLLPLLVGPVHGLLLLIREGRRWQAVALRAWYDNVLEVTLLGGLLDLQEAPSVLHHGRGLLEEVLHGLAVQVLEPVILVERIDLLLAERGGVGPEGGLTLVQQPQVLDHLGLTCDLHRDHRAHGRKHAGGRAHEAEPIAGGHVQLVLGVLAVHFHVVVLLRTVRALLRLHELCRQSLGGVEGRREQLDVVVGFEAVVGAVRHVHGSNHQLANVHD
mmetsp:Transcript_77253/g.222228  ORF Transcript_77253/g.222228 Transcript_77253/m.222228 type:complete len:234 (-) Transcript_77253:804-1505(-)